MNNNANKEKPYPYLSHIALLIFVFTFLFTYNPWVLFLIFVILIFYLVGYRSHIESTKMKKGVWKEFNVEYKGDDISNDQFEEMVKLWRKPGTKDVNIYTWSSVAGQGFMGKITHKQLAKNISKQVNYEAVIVEFTGKKMILNIRIID